VLKLKVVRVSLLTMMMDQHVTSSCKVFVLMVLMLLKTFMLDQTTKNILELMLVYAHINIMSKMLPSETRTSMKMLN
jgi:hypothetical protein